MMELNGYLTMADNQLPELPEGFELKKKTPALPAIPDGFTPKSSKSTNPELQVSQFLRSSPYPVNALAPLYDMLPSRDPARVSMKDRAKVNLVTDDPIERGKALRDLGYNDVEVVDGKAHVGGKRFDKSPSTLSISEMVSEVGENLDMAPGALIFTNPVTAILATAGTAAAREFGRQEMVPDADTDITTGITETALSAIPLVGKTVSPMFKALSGKATGEVKKAFGGALDKVKEGYERYGDEAFAKLDGVKKRVVERLDDRFGTSATLKQLGVTPEKFNDFNLKNVKDNYAYLLDASPEFKDISRLSGSGVRSRRIAELYDDVGSRIRDFYETSDATIPVSDIFSTESYKGLREGIFSVANSDEAVSKLMQQHDQMIESVWRSIEAEKMLSDPAVAQAAEKSGVGLMEFVRGNISKLQPNTSEDILAALSDQEVPIKYAWELRKHFDEWSAYKLAQKGSDDIPESMLLYRGMAGMFRDSIERSLPEGSEIAKDIKVFHNLVPIAQDMAVKASKDAGEVFKPNDFYISAIGGDLYRGLGYAAKIAKNPAARGYMSSAKDAVQEGIAGVMNGGRDVVENTTNPFISGLSLTASSREFMDNMGQEDPNVLQSGPATFQDLPELTSETLPMLAEKPVPLPRDPEAIGAKPEDLSLIEQAVSPNTALLFKDSLTSNDPLKRRLATVKVMQEAPELFEPSMYGIRSLIAEEDRFVIGDPQEAEFYRNTIKHLKGVGKVDENWYTRQLSALNDPKDMTVFPRPDITQQSEQPEQTTKSSLESINTSAGERRSYDY